MTVDLDGYAQRARNAGETLAEAAAALGRLDPGPRFFGADAPGRLGELGHCLYDRWATALAAREREAAAHGARCTGLAEALHLIGRTMRAVDQAAADRYRAIGTPPDQPGGAGRPPGGRDAGGGDPGTGAGDPGDPGDPGAGSGEG